MARRGRSNAFVFLERRVAVAVAAAAIADDQALYACGGALRFYCAVLGAHTRAIRARHLLPPPIAFTPHRSECRFSIAPAQRGADQRPSVDPPTDRCAPAPPTHTTGSC